MALLFNKLKLKELAKVPVRYKNGPNHWATLKKKKTPKVRALEHFDNFYANVYGKTWLDIRTALLEKDNKFVAVVNNFSDTERIRSELELQGAINLKAIYDTYKEEIEETRKTKKKNKSHRVNRRMDSVILKAQASEAQSFYPTDYEQSPEVLNFGEKDDKYIEKSKTLDPVQLKSIEKDLNEITLDKNRLIHPALSSFGIDEFMPASKIKGLENWVLESEYYEHYAEGSDFLAKIEKEQILLFPEHLHVYTFEEDNHTKFRGPKKGSTGVLDYYLFDGGSILPVLALDLQLGDAVLDMCAAPGGKTLAILQTLTPRLIVSNDLQRSRVNRINNVIEQYVSDIGNWESRFFITEQDARVIEDVNLYNKILVDVPCTTDRHVLHSDENNLFKPTRIQERLKIPEKQTEILFNALKLVTIGGTVVYSTCSLSPIQNDGVVQMALKKAWEENGFIMVVKDMSEALRPLNCLYKFGNFGLKYGHIVLPILSKNWGPMYFCKIVRVR